MCGWGLFGLHGPYGWFPGFGGLIGLGVLFLLGYAVWQLFLGRKGATPFAGLSCPGCQGPIFPAYFRCPACGRTLKTHCPGCSAVVETHWKYCPSCSRDLKPAASTPRTGGLS